MFNWLDVNQGVAQIKVYKNNDWVWLTIRLRKQDLKYLQAKELKAKKTYSPVLIKKGRTYYLQITLDTPTTLKTTPLKEQKVLSVDLGLNHSAVCSVVTYVGTVLGRRFINQPKEKDRQQTLLKRMRRKQKESKTKQRRIKLWNTINNLDTHIINDTVNQVVKYALAQDVDVIVLEYLNFKGKKRQSKAQLLQMWAYKTTNKKLCAKAHSEGLRYAHVNPKNTSGLAYDGSGKVVRNNANNSLCTFKSGKHYNTDLNAAYNIAARYFIQQILKTCSAKKRLRLEAKVPLVARRTQCTLSTLRAMYTYL